MLSICNKAVLVAALVAGTGALPAQDTNSLDPNTSVKFKLPGDSPLSLLTANYGESHTTARGGALVIDLHMAVTLRNTGPRRVRGVTLLLLAQDFTPGGKASVAAPSIDVAPGDAFPVRIDVQLLRPLQSNNPQLVEVSLDGVLFEDLGFYGPNRLNSRRSMTFWEMEAQRDRKYFKQVLQSRGQPGLQQEMLESLTRQAERPRLDVQLAPKGRSTSAVARPDHVAQFAFLQIPDSPVSPVDGWAEIAGNEARAPRINVLNRSSRAVRYVEIGWLVKDREGREFLAGSVPGSEDDLFLPSGQTARLLQDTSLKFSRGPGRPVPIQGMTGFVSQVEFADGKVWVPKRESLESSRLLRVIAPSPEEQRLADLYRRKGLAALVEELRKF